MNFPLRLGLACLLSCAVCAGRLSAYSRQGHEGIALLAYESPALKPAAKKAIDQILAGESPADAAEWPDAIKPPFGVLSRTVGAHAFLKEHPNAHLWHFVNFPVGLSPYDPKATAYALDTDIVHAIRGCIAVLEGEGDFDHLSKHEVLRYLIHLVGDVHQPLHTVTGYFDIHDPVHVKLLAGTGTLPPGAFKDAGGNDLYLSANQELHALWDDNLVVAITGKKDTASLVTALHSFSANANKTAGDYHNWAASWASDSMKVGALAYQGITFDAYKLEASGNRKPAPRITITLPADYKTNMAKVDAEQISKAAAHLVQLLNAIQWSN